MSQKNTCVMSWLIGERLKITGLRDFKDMNTMVNAEERYVEL